MSLENHDQRARMDTMEKELAVVKQTDKLLAVALAEHEWTQDPDPTVIFIGAKTLVSMASIENFVQAEDTRASIFLDPIDISGPPGGMAKRWRVSFSAKIQGTPTLAARRVNLILNNFKDESGQ